MIENSKSAASKCPAVSVLMAVHNGEPFLREALASVAAQTFTDYEFIIVEDGSTDGSSQILAEAAAFDQRIRLIRNETNIGLTRSLNVGLRQARGAYIARMDADDVSRPERLARQHAFMEQSPEHVAVGCGWTVIDDRGRRGRTVSESLDEWQMRLIGGFNPPAPHPTYFFRRQDSDGALILYDESFSTGQDFDLWSRLAERSRTAVLANVLLDYRRHAGAITVQKRRAQAINTRIIGTRNLRHQLPKESMAALEPLLSLFAYDSLADKLTIPGAVRGCDVLLEHGLSHAPSPGHRRWVKRYLAGLLADAILSRGEGLKSPASTFAFLVHARAYLPALAATVLSQPRLAAKSLRAVGKVKRQEREHTMGEDKGHSAGKIETEL